MYTERQELEIAIWDMYKDVNGIRPRFMDFASMSMDELRDMVDRLSVEMDLELQREAEAEKAAVARFEKLLADTIEAGAGNRETAIRWLRDAEPYSMGNDEMCYTYGLPYGYLDKAA